MSVQPLFSHMKLPPSIVHSPSRQQENYGGRIRDHFGCPAVKLLKEGETVAEPGVGVTSRGGEGGLELRMEGTTRKERGIALAALARKDGDPYDHRFEPFPRKRCGTLKLNDHPTEVKNSCKEHGDRCDSDDECESGLCYKWGLNKRKCAHEDYLKDNLQNNRACYRDWQCSPTDGTEAYCHTTKYDGKLEKAETEAAKDEATADHAKAAVIRPGENAPEMYKQWEEGKCKAAKEKPTDVEVEVEPIDKDGKPMSKTDTDNSQKRAATVIKCSDVVPAMMSDLAKKNTGNDDWSKYCVIRSTKMGDAHGFWNYDWRRRNCEWGR